LKTQKAALTFIIIALCAACANGNNTRQKLADYPEWVQDAVFYQIFPERFHNGDRSNDPDIESLKGSYPHDPVTNWHISPWTSDWYKLQPWEEANGRGFNHNSQLRRYGGDIKGAIDKLDYLKDLGINAIYFNPVFESPSLHKYDAASFIHIDDNFGPNPSLDKKIIKTEIPDNPATWKWTSADSLFLQLIKKAHEKGIRIIIDGVFNHVGITHWAFKDVKEKGSASKFKDWFTITRWDDPNTPEDEFDYEGWMGVRELPELREDENGLIEPIKKHIFNIVERWMDPNGDGDPQDGIDGWRLDVAEMVEHNFWKAFRKKVKSINPQAYITGEIFWDDWQNNKLMDPKPWLGGDQFDAVMNYRWSALATNFFIDKKDKISASEFINSLKEIDKSYSAKTKLVLQNLMDSHDTDRLSSNIVNPDLFYDKHVGASDNPEYDVRKPNEQERKIQKLIALFQFTSPGAPMIYYGTEAGMWGGDDPDERKPMVWPEFSYETEVANISQIPRPADEVKFDSCLYNCYKKLIHIRNKETALCRGNFTPVYFNDQKDILAFSREYQDEQLIIIINNSGQEQKADIEQVKTGKWTDLLTNKIYDLQDKQLTVVIEGKSGVILKRK
jgi:glycosidase